MKHHFAWTLHNVIGHPLSEILHLVGLKMMSKWIHEITIPKSVKDRGEQ